MNMKKMLALLLSLCMVFSLCSLGVAADQVFHMEISVANNGTPKVVVGGDRIPANPDGSYGGEDAIWKVSPIPNSSNYLLELKKESFTLDTADWVEVLVGEQAEIVAGSGENETKVRGIVQNRGQISGGTFSNDVHNANYAVDSTSQPKITGGTFEGYVENRGVISGNAAFTKHVVNETSGLIVGGSFKSGCKVENLAKIEGGVFVGEVTNRVEIIGGEFSGEVSNDGIISGGEFYGEVYNEEGATFGGTAQKMGFEVDNDGNVSTPRDNHFKGELPPPESDEQTFNYNEPLITIQWEDNNDAEGKRPELEDNDPLKTIVFNDEMLPGGVKLPQVDSNDPNAWEYYAEQRQRMTLRNVVGNVGELWGENDEVYFFYSIICPEGYRIKEANGTLTNTLTLVLDDNKEEIVTPPLDIKDEDEGESVTVKVKFDSVDADSVKEVPVELLKDGRRYKNKDINEKMNWKHKWEDLPCDEDTVWDVRPTEIPEGCEAEVVRVRGNYFEIILSKEAVEAPSTMGKPNPGTGIPSWFAFLCDLIF